MKGQSLKRQTAVMTGCNVLNRGLGFGLRLFTARLLGPEALGVMELAGQVHMLALTPAAAGLPGAVSRMTAAAEEEPEGIVLAARQLAVRMGVVLGLVMLVLSPFLARWMGDERILPSLVIYSPCVLLIGLSGVYRGYSLGRENAWPPALCEGMEQVVRVVVLAALAAFLPRLTLAGRAAVPALAGLMGEGAGMVLILLWLRPGRQAKKAPVQGKLLRSALPVMLNRLSHTLLRTGCSVLIPLRLCAAGMTHGEALGQMGMLNGMVMPLLFLPGMFSGALGTVSIPAVARRSGYRQRRLALRLLGVAGAVGAGSCVLLYAAAPVVGSRLYGQREVSFLLRALCPMAVLLPLQQVLGGMMMGLGLQRQSFYASVLGASLTLFFTYVWAARPGLGIYGAGYANLLGHGVTLLFCLATFFLHQKTAAQSSCDADNYAME